MKKKLHYLSALLVTLCLLTSISVNAQGRIDLNRATGNGVTLQSSSMTGFNSTFTFNSIESNLVTNDKGEFSEIFIDGSFPNGEVGAPELPMITKLIAIPDGATPVVTVGNYSETEYTLSDYGIGKVSAMQAPVRKNVDPSTVEYAVNEAAYARNSYNDDPIAKVEVLGTMRGLTLGRLIVQPVRYNPVAGTVKVFNDINVKVQFQNGDAASTAQMFKNTFSPAFNSVYDQIFNIDMLMAGGTKDAYSEHPDLYHTPVKMLVICYSGFKNNAALTSWLQWKLQKGYYVDIYYTDETGTSSSAIASFIKTKYNASVSAGNAYTYLIVIGDTGQVTYYTRDYEDSSVGYVASDLGYASVDFSSNSNDVFPDMFYSRMSVENTTHLTNYINKVLTYEKYEFADGGNYLNNVILVGGWDDTWTNIVAKPTINYATNYYFNSSNTTYGGFSGGTIKATISTSSTQGYSGTNNGCYQGINNGVCFLNYTAHGDKQEWYQPKLSATQVATLTNTGKYFFAVGNCCLTGNFNNTTTSYSPGSAIGTNACFAETMIRVPDAGAIAYIGCTDYTIWMEDYYWAVGSGIHFSSSYNLQGTATTSNTTTGAYDAMFIDNYWNSASSLLFIGNIAVTSAENNSNGYDTDAGYKYYFKYYHTFGDGSVMPFVTKPEANPVTIPSPIEPGTTSITVNAVAGSYVAVTNNTDKIYGIGVANSSGVATVNFTEAIPDEGTLYVVVTRQQYQPYFGTITVESSSSISVTATATPSIIALGNSSTLKATATGGTTYTYSWTPANSLNNANIQQPTATPTQTTEYTVTVSSNGDSNTATVTVQVVTPPTNLAANAIDCNSGIKLTWTAPSLATSYKIYRNGTQIAQNVTATTYTDSNLNAGTYSYQVGAVYEGVESKCAAVSKTLDGGTTITNTVNMTACDTYTWEGTTYANSGTYTKTFSSAGGCDSVVTMYLTINKSKTNEFSITSEEPYTWNGVTYSHTGDYTQTLTAANGCDSVVTLHLTYTGIEEDCYYTTTVSGAGDYIMGYLSGTTLTMPSNNGGNNTAMVLATSTVTATDYGFTADEDNTPIVFTLTSTGTTNQYYIIYNNRRLQRGSGTGTAAVVWTANNTTSTTRTKWYIDSNGIYQTGTSSSTKYYLYYNNGFYTSTSGTTNVYFYQEGDCPIPCASVTSEFSASACESYTWNGVTYTETGDYTQTFEIGGGGSGDGEVVFCYDFDNTPEEYDGWYLIDADGDDNDWGIYSFGEGNGYNGSTYVMASFSYDNDNNAVLTPDNWIIMPQSAVGNNAVLSFYACGLDPDYAAEYFGVYIATTANLSSTADFTELNAWTATGTWTQYTVDLSAYAGQNVYIAFRHYNVSDQFVLAVDDVCLTNNAAKSSAIVKGNTPGLSRDFANIASAQVNINKKYLAIGEPSRYTMPVRETCDSIVTLHLTITGDITNEFSVTTCADSYTWNDETYTESGDYTQTFSLGIEGDEFFYDFDNTPESYAGWELLNADEDTLYFGVYKVTGYGNNGSDYFALSESYYYNVVGNDTIEEALSPDNWLLLPSAYIGTESTLTFYARGFTTSYYHEHFGVFVTTNADYQYISDFTEMGSWTTNADWTLYTVDLSSYAGQDLIIAFRHYDCTDQYWLGIDDIRLSNGTAKAANNVASLPFNFGRNSEMLNRTSANIATRDIAGGQAMGMKLTEPTRGCDSIVTLHLTLLQNQVSDPEVVTACESYSWNGTTYTTSGNYTHVTDIEGGCTLTETLQLTINHNETVAPVSADACESYEWNGTTYTTSGTYTHTTELEGGCTRTETLNLTIHHNEIVEPEVVEACESFTWHGNTYSSSGVYNYVTNLEAGCTKTETLNLTIYHNQNVEPETVSACDSYTWHGTTYTSSGMYEYTTELEGGCTKTETLYLTINYNQNAEPVVMSVCEGYTWYGNTYTESGTYTHESTLGNGCTKTETLILTINHNVDVPAVSAEACESYTWNGQTYNQSGTYSYTTDLGSGCVQTETLNLTIYNNETVPAEVVEACESYTWHNQTYTTSGNYSYTSELETGCTRTESLHLTIHNNVNVPAVTASACEEYEWYGTTYTTSGTYTHTTELEAGCVKTETLNLTIHNNVNVPAGVVDACETYTWHGTAYTESGTYEYVTDLEAGCTKTETLQLTIHNNEVVTPEVVAACESYTWHGTAYTESGTYEYVTDLEAGCTRTETLQLTINHNEDNELAISSCTPYTWHGTTYNNSGDYEFNGTTENGCALHETLHLTINSAITNDIYVDACETYTWTDGDGQTYTASGTHEKVYATSTCDSTVILHLTIHHNETAPTETVEACDNYKWNGVDYTESGYYTAEIPLEGGCVRYESISLTINNSETETFTVAECDSYEWNGTIYNTSGVYTFNTTTAAGCERVETLNLTINNSEAETFTATECDSYEWNGTTYETSGVYTFNTTTAAGCERVETLNLTINYSEHPEYNVVECDSYTWHATEYTTSGTYTYEGLTATGCPRVETLNLTINQSGEVTVSETACDSYTWDVNGVTYNQSGSYTYTTTTPSGCTFVETLELTINESETENITVTECDEYEWYGETYSTSGTYTHTSNLPNGCTKTETLLLTINNSETESIDETACDNYTWYGEIYTTSGEYTHESTTAAGCPRIETLNLTINNSEAETFTATECNSYEWNGQTYTASGTYTYNTTTAAGCPRTETLELTINYSETENFTATECDSYTWNGEEYTESGTYTFETTTAAGCERIETLTLTINNSETEEFTATECDTYTWNGEEYTESGVYTFETTTAAGCERIETLNLTINNSETETFDVTECEAYTWNGEEYTESGTYTFETTTAAGCPRVETLNLTIPVVEAVITGATEIELGDETTLTAEGGVSFEWSTGETTESITVAPTETTTYTVTVTDENGCTGTAEVTIAVDGVNELANSIKVYPNPAKHIVNVEADNITNIRVMDMLGQILYETNASSNRVQIDLGSYAVGQYFLQVKTTNGVTTKKVVKK